MEAVALSVPDVPAMVIGYVPATVDAATANVTTLEVVDEAGLNVAVTPVGRPDAAKVTLPANGLTSVTVIVSVPLAPGATVRLVGEAERLKLPRPVTVSEMEVVALSVPEVPVIVIGYVPATVVAATANVTTLELADEVGLNEVVTPVGMPEAANDTLPVNVPVSWTVIVSVPLAPWAIDSAEADGVSVKPDAEGTVSVMVVVTGVSVPEVPVMVIGYVPATVVAATASVTTLELVDEVGLNEAVTPVGMPEAANDTLPVNGLTSVTVMVSVPLAPRATVRADAEGVSLKPPVAAPQVVPFIANDAGTALVVPFQVPLNPTPERLPPAAMLPL
jgi:hypothetical protein